MPTQPIVMYNRKDTSESDKLAKIIAMEKMSSSIAGTSEMLNKGIEAYQNLKAKKQANDLAAINAAGSLIGGIDRLPKDTLNKLPSILKIDLPRDAQGNVVVTPSAQDVINRATAKAAEADPITFGRVAGGVQQKAPSPEEIKQQQETNEVTRQGNILKAKTDVLTMENENAQKALDRADKEKQNIRDNETRIATAGGGGPAVRLAHAKEPSDFWINKKTGEVLSKPAAEMTLGPTDKLEEGWWNPSNEALKQHTDARKAQASVDRARSNTDVDKARVELINARVKQVGAKDPGGLKMIMDGLNEAQKLKKAGAPNADQVLKYWTEEFIRSTGQEAKPDEYPWMIQMLPQMIQSGYAWLEGKTGRGSEHNLPGPSKVEAATGGAVKAGGGEAPKGKVLSGSDAMKFLGLE